MNRRDEGHGPGPLQEQFWIELLRRSRGRTPIFANTSPRPYTWLETRTGYPGTKYMYLLRNIETQVVLSIDRGMNAEVANKQLFDQLKAAKAEIEPAFGESIEWERGQDRVAKIGHTVRIGGLHNEEYWPEMMDAMIDGLIQMDAALHEPLRDLLGRA